MFTRIGSTAFKKDLTNIRQLCGALGHPQERLRCIHVAGTNGKGSVSHMLAAVLQTAGYKTGLYTSPHLYDFRERIRVNGEMVSKEFVIDFTAKIQPLIEAIQPSFFEITVAMAFDYFARQQVDVAVIEVGLGGRLDSTNIITPVLSVITNIGLDHMNMLGDTVEQIAFEKAGIIKPNVPVVIGEANEIVAPVFKRTATGKNASIIFAEHRYPIGEHSWQHNRLAIVYTGCNGKEVKIVTDLAGVYQVKNVATVLTAIDVLKTTYKISDDDVRTALQHVKTLTGLQGRWDIVHEHPKIVLEVAHNEDGIMQMLEHITEQKFDLLRLVIGFVKDKDIEAILQLLPGDALYYFTQADIPRALNADELQKQAHRFGLHGATYIDVNAALRAAMNDAAENDLIVVCGSIFLVAEVEITSVLQFP